jgi:hypothetical protein
MVEYYDSQLLVFVRQVLLGGRDYMDERMMWRWLLVWSSLLMPSLSVSENGKFTLIRFTFTFWNFCQFKQSIQPTLCSFSYTEIM